MEYATIEDVETRIGRELSDSERDLARALLGDALLIIHSRCPDLDERVENGEISADVVRMIQANMVVRVLRNPEGIRQETDGDYSYTIAASTPVGDGLSLTRQELSMLCGRGTIGSFRPTLPVPGHWPWRGDVW